MELIVSREFKIPEISYPENPLLSEHIRKIYEQVKTIDESLYKNYLSEFFTYHNHSIRNIRDIISDNLKKLNSYQNEHSLKEDIIPALYECQKAILSGSEETMSDLNDNDFQDQHKLLTEGIEFFIENINNLVDLSPDVINHELNFSDLKIKRSDNLKTILFKMKKQASLYKGKTKYKIEFSDLLKAYFEGLSNQIIYEELENLGLISFQYLIKVRKMNEQSFNSSIKLEKIIKQKILSSKTIDSEISNAEILYEEFIKLNETSLQSLYTLLLNKTIYVVQMISNDMKLVNTNSIIKRRKKDYSKYTRIRSKVQKIPDKWLSNQKLVNNMNILESELTKFVIDLRFTFLDHRDNIDRLFDMEIIGNLKRCDNILKGNIFNGESLIELKLFSNKENIESSWKDINEKIVTKIKERTADLPKSYEIMSYDIFEDFKVQQFNANKAVSLLIKDFCEYTIENDYLILLNKNLEEAQLKVSDSFTRTEKLIHELNTFYDSDNEKDHIYNAFIDSMIIKFGEERSQIEKIKIKLLNQISERRNSLSDSFTLSSILRKTNTMRRFVRR